MVISVGER